MSCQQVMCFPVCNPLPPPAELLAALPFLRRLSIPLLNVWWDDQGPRWAFEPERVPAGDKGAILAALAGLRHLSSLEVGLRPLDPSWGPLVSPAIGASCWSEVLEAAPKQLQPLSFRVVDRHLYRNPGVPYDWAALEPFTQLKQLHLGYVAADVGLAPLAQLPALDGISIQQAKAAALEPLLEVKGLLRELEVGHIPADQQQHLEQLTALTSLTLSKDKEPGSLLPTQVAAGLCQLDWTLDLDYIARSRLRRRSADSSSSGGSSFSSSTSSSSASDGIGISDLLAHCSSAKLRDLQLRGQGWARHTAAAAAAVQQLTGLTSFGLHAAPGKELKGPRSWLALMPMRHLRHLRCLALPRELLASEQQPWLGRLPHLTRIHMAAASTSPHYIPGLRPGRAWDAEHVLGGPGEPQGQLLSNLRSCSATLRVLEVNLTLTYDMPWAARAADALPEAVRALLQRALPGVHVLVSRHIWVSSSEEDGGGSD